jgi:hypothetical protein
MGYMYMLVHGLGPVRRAAIGNPIRKCIYCISEKEKGAAMYSVLQPVLDVLNERLDRARGRGDHARVLILEGEIRKLTAKMVGLRTQ